MWNRKHLSSRFGTIRRAVTIAAACSAALLSADAAAQQAGPSQDYHVVSEGDTLYDLSGAYYGDVYQWPKLWSYNAHITNPHWIYPGDIIYLRPPKAAPQAGAQAASEKATEGGLHMPAAGFITKEKLEYSGRITGSPKEANLLSPLDVAWVGFGEDAYTDEEQDELSKTEQREMSDSSPKEGDLYAIVREAGTIEDSDGNEVGQKYLVIGSLRITEVSDEYFDTSEIVQAWREIERGDYLIPYERQLKVVEPVKSDKDMVAEIVDGIDALFDYGEFHYVFVNKGAEDGIRPGNRFFVYQRREGLDFRGTHTDDKVPWRRVGQVMVIDVREQYSLAVITDSAREVNIGDRLEMYEGY
jgi:hypothetical protein